MKNFFSLVLCSLLFVSCSITKSRSKFNIEEDDITRITMEKSFGNVPLELSQNQIKELIPILNHSLPIGPTKFMGEYWINIYLSNDSILKLKCHSNIFSIGNSFAHKTKTDDFFHYLWAKIDGDKIAWKQFTPVDRDDKNGVFYIIHNYNLSEEDMINISRVLNNYNIENMIIDNKIYYRGEEFNKELLWNYTLKSRDKQWLQDHSPNPDL